MKLSLAPLASVLAIAACAPPLAPMTPDPEPASETSTTSAAEDTPLKMTDAGAQRNVLAK